MLLSRQLLIDQKGVAADANADSGPSTEFFWYSVDTVLEVVFALLLAQGLITDLHGTLFVFIADVRIGQNCSL